MAEHALGEADCLVSLQTLHLSCNCIWNDEIHCISDLITAQHTAVIASQAITPSPSTASRQQRRRQLSSVQLAMRHWRKASKTRRKTIPWSQRQRAPDLTHRARIQHTTHRVCDDLLVVGVEWSKMQLGQESDGWSSSAVSALRRHGRLSAVEAGRAVLIDGSHDYRLLLLEKLEGLQ